MKKQLSTLAASILAASSANSSTISYRFEGELNTDNQFLSEYRYATGVISFFDPGIQTPTSTNLTPVVGGPPGPPGGQTSEPTTVFYEHAGFSTSYTIDVETSSLLYSNSGNANVGIANMDLPECLLYYLSEYYCSQQGSDSFSFSTGDFYFAIDNAYDFDNSIDGTISSLNLGAIDFVSLFEREGTVARISIFAGDLTYNITNIAPVPIPATAWLFGSALIGLLAAKRKS